MKYIKYNILLSKTLSNKRKLAPFVKTIKKILSSKDGWEKSNMIKFKYSKSKPDVIITLASSQFIKKTCFLTDLSCTVNSTPVNIYINEDRWFGGSKQSKLSLAKYRQYLIHHEMFHAILFINNIFDDKYHHNTETIERVPCSIRTQQTIGIGNNKPNYLPTPEDIALLIAVMNMDMNF